MTHPWVPMTDAEKQQILASLHLEDVTQLYRDVPQEVQLHRPLALPPTLSEAEASRLFRQHAAANLNTLQATCFLGAGAYDHFVPAICDWVTSRGEFLTAYTPYQAEASQGVLTAIFEYQSMIATLCGCAIANASMYDGASACAEALLMAVAHTGRAKVLVSQALHPHYLQTLRTYLAGQSIEVESVPQQEDGRTSIQALQRQISKEVAAVCLAQPNFYGAVETLAPFAQAAHQVGALFVTTAYPVALGLLQPPGEAGADVVVGEGQPLGCHLNWGGPYVGFFATQQPFLRRLPGRIVGETKDEQGRRGYVLTMQTREQHIRRERATSNICTNETLLTLANAAYLAWMGPQGLRRVAELSLQKAHYTARQLESAGFHLAYTAPFFNEFVVDLGCPAAPVVEKLAERNLLAGVPLSTFDSQRTTQLLIAVTEQRTRAEIDTLVAELKEVCSQ